MNNDKRSEYSYCLSFNDRGVFWQIVKIGEYDENDEQKVVWEADYKDTENDPLYPPAIVRAKYEELIGHQPEAQSDPIVNLVEMMADEDCAFDQPCAYGHRVEGHAVYCHNTTWLYAPCKCRRTWYTGGTERDEDCEGYKPNPTFKLVAAA